MYSGARGRPHLGVPISLLTHWIFLCRFSPPTEKMEKMESDVINSPTGLLRFKILSSSSLSSSLQDGSLGDSLFPPPMEAFEAGVSAPLTALQRDCFVPELSGCLPGVQSSLFTNPSGGQDPGWLLQHWWSSDIRETIWKGWPGCRCPRNTP